MQDMHHAEFAEDEVGVVALRDKFSDWSRQGQALLNAIREYEANKWKTIGLKVGKPAKVGSCRNLPHDPPLRL